MKYLFRFTLQGVVFVAAAFIKFILKTFFCAKNLVGIFKVFTVNTMHTIFLVFITKSQFLHTITDVIITDNSKYFYPVFKLLCTDPINTTAQNRRATLNNTEYDVGCIDIPCDIAGMVIRNNLTNK